MLNVKTFMAFLLGYVEMELGTYYSKWLKRQNRAYRPVLYLSADVSDRIPISFVPCSPRLHPRSLPSVLDARSVSPWTLTGTVGPIGWVEPLQHHEAAALGPRGSCRRRKPFTPNQRNCFQEPALSSKTELLLLPKKSWNCAFLIPF